MKVYSVLISLIKEGLKKREKNLPKSHTITNSPSLLKDCDTAVILLYTQIFTNSSLIKGGMRRKQKGGKAGGFLFFHLLPRFPW